MALARLCGCDMYHNLMSWLKIYELDTVDTIAYLSDIVLALIFNISHMSIIIRQQIKLVFLIVRI